MTSRSTPTQGKAPGERFAELDLLRFIAAISVVAYHYSAFQSLQASDASSPIAVTMSVMRYGYLGVDLFFLISGFVILASALNRSCLEFVISRATRLYPAYWVAVCLATLTTYWLAPATNGITPVQFIANLSMLNDYFRIQDIDGVYWTLHAEMKFYFCIFILIATGWIKHVKQWLGIWTAVTACYLITHQPFFMGWFISPHYSSYFIGGAAFYMIRKEGPHPYYLGIAAVSLLLSSIYSYRHTAGFLHSPTSGECWTATAIIWFSYAVFYALARGRLALSRTPTLLLLGGLTYPLYLMHAKSGHLLFEKLSATLAPHWAILWVTLGMLAVAAVLHIYIEKRASNVIRRKLETITSGLLRKQ